jgi:hypothetical protein
MWRRNDILRIDKMNILSIFTDLYKDEVQAEIEMLSAVLGSVGLSREIPCAVTKLPEQRTWLISRLKYVPKIIENLKSDASIRYDLEKTKIYDDLKFFKQKETELEEKLRNEEDERCRQKIEYEEIIKSLKKENEFLRSTKEKIYILRGGR